MAEMDLNSPVAPANMGVMGQEKAPRTQKTAPAPQKKTPNPQPGRKKASEIISEYVMQQTGSQQEVNKVMTMLDALIKRRISRLIQFGNTVFWATQHGRGTVDIHIFSLDSPRVLIQHMREAYQWFKQHGFTKVTSTFTDEQQMGVVKASGLPFTLQRTQASNGKQMVPAFNMTMEIR